MPILLLYADLPGYLASVSFPSTIPTKLSTTLNRPDLILVSNNSIILFELIIPTNTQQHLLAAKACRYGSLLYYLQQTGLTVNLISRMFRSLYARNTCSSGYCLLCAKTKLYSYYLSRQVMLPSPASTEFLTLEVPVSGISWTPYPELFF